MIQLKFLCFSIVILFSFNSFSQTFPDVLYEKLNARFEARGISLENRISEFESLLLAKKTITDTTWQARRKSLEMVANAENLPYPKIADLNFIRLKHDLSLQRISEITVELKSNNPSEFDNSKFAGMLNQIESYSLSDRAKTTTIAQVFLNNLNDEDFQHPFYRALYFLTFANIFDLDFRSKDQFLVTPEDYSKYLGDNFQFPLIESRNNCFIHVNIEGEILVRENPTKLKNVSLALEEIINKNRLLTKEEAEANIKNPNYEGYEFPFYSNISLIELDKKISEAYDVYAEATAQNQPEREISMAYLDLFAWQNKKQMLLLSRADYLTEIHPHFIVRVQAPEEYLSSVAYLLKTEFYEAYLNLRNAESENIFGMNYEEIYNRHNYLLNDFAKVQLLEHLFPVRIYFNSAAANMDSPPPTEEIIKNK